MNKKYLFVILLIISSISIVYAATSNSGSSADAGNITVDTATATPTPYGGGTTTTTTATPTTPSPPPGLTITADTSSVQVGISKGVTFYVEKPGTVTCMAVDCPEPESAVPISGAYVYLEGVATGSGNTDQNGYVTIYINANSAGTITVIASKSGYSDSSITITAEIPPTPQPIISVAFISDKNSYVRDNLVYLTMKNDGDQSVILSVSNSIHWWVEDIIYSSGATSATEIADATSDSGAIATSDSTVSNTQLFPGDSITVPWDQRDNNKNLVSQGKYRACVRWSYNGQYYQSCTQTFDIIVQNTPTPSPITYNPIPPVTYTPIPSPSITPILPKKKDNFRIGPTINLRPVKDEISKTEDGLIELYMDNPSLNDVVMCADVRISVPSGISVYGQGFGDAGSAGVVHGTFDISPGKARTIQMTVKAEKTGEFLIKFSGLYWPGDNKDAFQPISLTHNFKVHDISTPKTVPTTTKGSIDNPGIVEGFGIFIKSILDFLDNILGPT